MKFLQAAVLSVICVGYVIASDPDYDDLQKAIHEGNLDIAVGLGNQNEKLGKVGVEYVIAKKDPAFIANFVSQTNQANASTLEELWHGNPIETVEKVLEKVDFPQQALVDLATSYEVGAYPDKFLVLLNRIVKPEDQEKAVETCIERLVDSYMTPSPLLNALKGKAFRSSLLEHLAIQKAFMEGIKCGKPYLLPDDICNHAAITPELYAGALIVTAEQGKHGGVRLFLLKNADRYDLEAVKEKPGYVDLNVEFHDDIEEALKTAQQGGTRTRTYDIQTVEKAEEVFGGLRYSGIFEDIFSIAGGFVAFDAPARREGQIASKKATKNVASDVTSISTTRTESSRIRKRKGGKGKGKKKGRK